MKILTVFLGLSTTLLALVCILQLLKIRDQNTRLAALENSRVQAAQQIEDLQEAQQRSADQRKLLLNQSEELAAQLQARQAPAPPSPPEVSAAVLQAPVATETSDSSLGGFGKMIGKLMQDPDMKKFIHDQQRGMMDQLYSPLIKQLGLTDEETANLKDLLSETMMKGTEKAFSLLDGTNRSAAASSLVGDQQEFQDKIRALLGDDRYAKFQNYQETMGERAQLNVFKQQNACSALTLSDPQTEALLNMMQEEKKYVTSLTGQKLPGYGQNQENIEAMFSGEKTDQMLQLQEQINQRVFQRAATLLSPDQLSAFGSFQANQLQMMRMGMGMARKLFSPDNADAPVSAPGP